MNFDNYAKPPYHIRKKCKRKGSFSWKKVRGKLVLDPPGLVYDSSPSECGSCSSLSSGYSTLHSSISGSNSCLCSDKDVLSDFELDCHPDFIRRERNTRRTRTLQQRNVTVIIPEKNLSCYHRNEFYLEFIEDTSFLPSADSRMVYVSKIVSVGPHGARFHKDNPALIYLPLTEKVLEEDQILCMCSNTPKDSPPSWERLPKSDYYLKNGRIVIKARHFSLFTVVIERPFPEVRRDIDPKFGATLRVPEIPGVEVCFPKNSLIYPAQAFVRVLYDLEPEKVVSIHNGNKERALATPIIMVGPHGCRFNPNSSPVKVKLPVPHYIEINDLFGLNTHLTVWQSSTTENEPLLWEPLDVQLEVQEEFNGLYTICFNVYHFSFFKALWDVLSTSLYEAKLGVAFFYPFISFSMMCQAWMQEVKDTQHFGLEVICYRSDNRLPEATNYKYKVGGSLKPKLVRPGCIIVSLKSELFEANTDTGESSLTKQEPDFRGREFEKQFSCRFKLDKPLVERGTFGKVVVERQCKTGNEPLFEFNLDKTGLESEIAALECTDRWSVVAITELAGTLNVLKDNNWKKFARNIGFTKNEVQSKLAYSPDPFLAMVNLYQSRGGTPEEFVQALYVVSRQISIQNYEEGGASTSGSPDGSRVNASPKSWLNLGRSTPTSHWRDNKSDTDTASAASVSTSSRKRSNPNSGSSSGKNSNSKRRRRFSDVSETMSSSEDSSHHSDTKRNNLKLNNTDLWSISEYLCSKNWRALGRAFGLDEPVFINIEHKFKDCGDRECCYQLLLEWKGRRPSRCTYGFLYQALVKEKMNSVAKSISIMKLGELP